MTDYNDGEWHRWDCECEPKGIHPLSQIETIYHDEKGRVGINNLPANTIA